MEMKTIRNKLREIQQRKEQAIANVNALCGAEQILLELIAEADAMDAKEDKPDE